MTTSVKTSENTNNLCLPPVFSALLGVCDQSGRIERDSDLMNQNQPDWEESTVRKNLRKQPGSNRPLLS